MTNSNIPYRASNESIEERNELVLRELPKVYYIAARIHERLPRQVDIQDLVQAGVIGLLDACRNYDNQKDAQFHTFARHRIRGAILDSLRQLDWGSRTLRRRGREIAASVAKLESQLGRQPLEEEIAAELQMRVDKFQDTVTQLDRLFLVGQLVHVFGDDAESFDLIESAPSAGRDNPCELCLEGEMKVQLAAAVSRISEREQLILSLYYYEELTMKEVSEVVGIAVSRVSQIHAAAMLKMRVSLAHLRQTAAPVDRAHAGLQSTNRRQAGIDSSESATFRNPESRAGQRWLYKSQAKF
jgi:RNA polymerase sigma factor for flagellar operon FliA